MQQGRFADARVAAKQDDCAGNKPAAENRASAVAVYGVTQVEAQAAAGEAINEGLENEMGSDDDDLEEGAEE